MSAMNGAPRQRMIARVFALVLASASSVSCGSSVPPTSSLSPAAIKKTIEPTDDDKTRDIPLQGVRNARGFGGLEGDSHAIPGNHFFRSASLSSITESDKDTLIQHGVALDIDLRTFWESSRSPDLLSRDSRFRYVRISLLGSGFSDVNYMEARGDLYVRALANHQREFREIFRLMAEQKEGAVLFHCSSGKDRTGMIAALLLNLAGVSDDDIIHNYVLSAHYLFPTAPEDSLRTVIMLSPPSAIAYFLHVLEKDYGGAKTYMKTIGLRDAEIQTLATRLGQ